MFAKIAYKQNINMWKISFSLQHLKLIISTKLFFRPKTSFANDVLKYFFNYFRISELEIPGTWKLGTWSSRNLGTSELGNLGTWELFKGIPKMSVVSRPI